MLRFAAAISLIALLFGFAVPAYADNRVALVIGNGAYQNTPRLPNPSNDAADVAASLKRSGFETILATDLDKAAMDAAMIRFARASRTADVAIFYYSGHAMQFGGVNYLAPIDAKLTDEADLRRMVRVDEIVSDLQQAKNLRILVLDSCRDNPLADELKRSIGTTRALPLQRGLAKIDSPQGMIVAYATQSGRTALDHAGVFVHDDHAAGTHDGSDFSQCAVPDVDVGNHVRNRNAPARRSAGLYAFQRPVCWECRRRYR